MLTEKDLLRLPYTSDLSLGGVVYACRSLHHTYNRMGGSPYERMRRIAAGVAMELAFRRFLSEEGVSFDVLGATPYTEPDRYDVSIAGRRCDLKTYLIYRRDKIQKIRRRPYRMLSAPALVPADQFDSTRMRDSELLVFGFLLGLIAPRGGPLAQAQRASQPDFLVHALPGDWARPVSWSSLGALALKSEGPEPLMVEIGGQDAHREFITERMRLEPLVRAEASRDFYSLSYVHISRLPAARVGLHSPAMRQSHLVHPGEWENIWIYGLEVILAGYLTLSEFRRRARRLPAGSRVLQYPVTRTENLMVPLSELKPLDRLVRGVRGRK